MLKVLKREDYDRVLDLINKKSNPGLPLPFSMSAGANWVEVDLRPNQVEAIVEAGIFVADRP